MTEFDISVQTIAEKVQNNTVKNPKAAKDWLATVLEKVQDGDVRSLVQSIVGVSSQQSKIVQLTANCVVKRHGFNNTIEIQFRQKSYPSVAYRTELAKYGFTRSSRGKSEHTYIAPYTDAAYQFALDFCRRNEAPGIEKQVEEAERAKYSQDIEEKRFNELLDKGFESRKVNMDNLSDDVLEMMQGGKKVNVVIYSPNVDPVAVSGDSLDPSFLQIMDDIGAKHNVYLVGGAGTGKTTLAMEIAKILKRNYRTINCSQWTSPMEIIGGFSIDGWSEGKLIEAWRDGDILILDELPKIDPNTAGLLNDALAKTTKPLPEDRIIENAKGDKFQMHENFAVIGTGNIYPNSDSVAYGANNKQDLSLLDRFAGCVYWIEKDEKKERTIIGNNIVWSLCNRLREKIDSDKMEAQVSLRLMQNVRDAYYVEMARIKAGSDMKNVINPGANIKNKIDSFLSTFNEMQRDELKKYINYDKHIAKFQYRNTDPTTVLCSHNAASHL